MKVKLTDDERSFLKMLNPKWKWIAKDKDGFVAVFVDKPVKKYNVWYSTPYVQWEDLLKDSMFSFIKWEDEEPYNIEELLKGNK